MKRHIIVEEGRIWDVIGAFVVNGLVWFALGVVVAKWL